MIAYGIKAFIEHYYQFYRFHLKLKLACTHITTTTITSHTIITARRILQCCFSLLYSVSVQTVYSMFSLQLIDPEFDSNFAKVLSYRLHPSRLWSSLWSFNFPKVLFKGVSSWYFWVYSQHMLCTHIMIYKSKYSYIHRM